MSKHYSFSKLTRRDLLRAGMYGVGVTAGALPLPLFAQAGAALAAQGKHDGKILVVLELSGGNDGLNTLVPYGDDAYYQHFARTSASPRRNSGRSTITSASAEAWPVSNVYIRMASWPSSTAADTRILRSRTSRRWRTGTRRRPTAARSTAGWAVWRTRWLPTLPRTFW